MKKLGAIYIIIIVILLAISVFFYFTNLKKDTILLQEQENVFKLNRVNDRLKDKNEVFLKNMNLSFNDKVKLINSSLDTITITGIFSENEMLCLYFTEEMCSPCVEFHLHRLKEYAQEYGTNKLCFFINFRNKESMKNINKKYLTSIPFYFLKKEDVPFYNDTNKPVLFILNKDLVVRACFNAEGELSKLNDVYFESIDRFFN
jgi:hypothetical protein